MGSLVMLLQTAETSKIYAEEKEEEVKILERSVEELEGTITVLEEEVGSLFSFSFGAFSYYQTTCHNEIQYTWLLNRIVIHISH